MIIKNDCVELANRLLVELKLDRQRINSVIEIDGEFVWLIVERVFNTSLLPKWRCLDCVNETEEFQFILQTLEQIFDLDLAGVNPAYLTMRKPAYVYLVLNALWVANDYLRSKKMERESSSSTDLSSPTDLNEKSGGSEMSLDIVSSDLSNLSIDSSDELSASSSEMHQQKKGAGAKVGSSHKVGKTETSSSCFSEENSLKLPTKLPTKQSKKPVPSLVKNNSKKKLNLPSRTRKELTDNELANKLKELKDGKQLVQSLTHQKEQNFALQISFKILDLLRIQEKTKKIKSNLNQMHAYAPQPSSACTWQTFHSNLTGRPKTCLPKKITAQTRRTKKRQPAKNAFVKQSSNLKKSLNSGKPLDLNELVNNLTGLSSNQLNELKDKSTYQEQLVKQVKCDLIEAERRLQNEMIAKIERENRLLEGLQKDLHVDLNLSAAARNRAEREQIRNAKYKLRKERVDLKRSTDELYRVNLSNLKHLEAEQDRQLAALSRSEEQSVREQIQQAKKEIRQCETKIREEQKLLLDDYDHLYLSQTTMIRQEIARQTTRSNGDPAQFNSVSLSRHLARSFASKLIPKFS